MAHFGNRKNLFLMRLQILCWTLASVGCAQTPMGAQAALFRGQQALRTARATGTPKTDEAARHLALASAQLEQAHALATSGQIADANCAAERSTLDSHLSAALNAP